MTSPRPLLVILGNQLFPLRFLPPARDVGVFMAEDMGLCTYEKHHQQKIVLFLAAIAVLIATINISGGFLVTRRMLAMFQKS